MDDLDEIRARKLQEYQRRLQEQAELERQREMQEMQINAILSKILTPDAKARLSNVRLANPRLAERVTATLVYLYQSGRVARKITDVELKKILLKLTESNRRDTNIRIVRK